MRNSFRPFFWVLVVLVSVCSARAAELPIIAKARASLGTESALNTVKTIHYTGSVTITSGADKPASVKVDILFAGPERQRVVVTAGKDLETTVLDGYDAWKKIEDTTDKTRWRLTFLSKDQIKRLRANTWENVSFFRNIERIGGEAKDLGPATVDGIACMKVGFIHSDEIVFYRYFDQKTGQLVLSETETGMTIREQGEIIAAGVRFPKQITSVAKNADGIEQRVVMTFEQVTVNEAVDDSLFAVPTLNH